MPGSSSTAGGGSGAAEAEAEAGAGGGAAFSLLVSCEEDPELSLPLLAALTEGSTSEEAVGSAGSEEGGRGARKRGSGGGRDAATVGWGMRGMGKSL